MDNIFLFKSEIIIFFLSLSYIIFYLSEKIRTIFLNIKNIIKPDKSHLTEKIEKLKDIESKRVDKQSKNFNKIKKQNKNIGANDSKKIAELIKRVRLNSAKGFYDKAISLIVEGLAIDKTNKDLNLELASIYEEQKEYLRAEFVYNDLLNSYENNFEILKKLAFNLAIQQKYDESIEVYLSAFNKNKSDMTVIEHLSDLFYQLKNYKKALKFIKLFLKQHPKNTEKMKMKAFCLETLGDVNEAIDIYKKVLALQPYNTQVIEKLKFLEQNS